MRALRLALVPAGIAFGVWAEWSAYEAGQLAPVLADLAVGCVLVVCGAIAWELRPATRTGALMCLSGLTWFLGTAFTPMLYLHRGPLVHLVLSYPTGMLAGVAAAVVAAAYLDGAVRPLAEAEVLTLVLSGAVIGAAAHTYLGASGPLRAARRRALGAALAFGGVLVVAAVGRLAGWDADRAVLWAYDVVIAAVGIVLFVDLLRGRWREQVMTGLVLDLGAAGDGATLEARLARALGDPSLVLGYRLHESGMIVDETGLAVELPEPGSGRAVTPVGDRGDVLAVLIHDEAVLADPGLVDSVAAAARIAVANARLQSEARIRAGDLEASRRRLVEAGDTQRRRLELELRVGAERRLESVAARLAEARDAASRQEASGIEALERDLDAARGDLREFAHGIHPAVLTQGGFMPALAVLAERSPLPVEVSGSVERLPDAVGATCFFVCSEALANTAKHAGATRVRIEIRADDNRLVLVVSDDGVGGASPSGSGLRGLADRVETHGGRLSVDSPPAGGTRVVAELPLQ